MSEIVNPADSSQPLARRIVAALLIASGAVVFIAERDLRARPAAEIRGPKLLWRVGSTNALVAFGYLRWGRRA